MDMNNEAEQGQEVGGNSIDHHPSVPSTAVQASQSAPIKAKRPRINWARAKKEAKEFACNAGTVTRQSLSERFNCSSATRYKFLTYLLNCKTIVRDGRVYRFVVKQARQAKRSHKKQRVQAVDWHNYVQPAEVLAREKGNDLSASLLRKSLGVDLRVAINLLQHFEKTGLIGRYNKTSRRREKINPVQPTTPALITGEQGHLEGLRRLRSLFSGTTDHARDLDWAIDRLVRSEAAAKLLAGG